MEEIGAVLIYCLTVPVAKEFRSDRAGAVSLLSMCSGYWMVVKFKAPLMLYLL